MIAFDHMQAHREHLPEGSVPFAKRQDLADSLKQAAMLLDDDPDVAALLLDGILQGIVAVWFEEQGRALPALEQFLASLERISPPVAWRLRLALRSPNAQARLVHAQELYRVAFGG